MHFLMNRLYFDQKSFLLHKNLLGGSLEHDEQNKKIEKICAGDAGIFHFQM